MEDVGNQSFVAGPGRERGLLAKSVHVRKENSFSHHTAEGEKEKDNLTLFCVPDTCS